MWFECDPETLINLDTIFFVDLKEKKDEFYVSFYHLNGTYTIEYEDYDDAYAILQKVKRTLIESDEFLEC